MICLMHGKDMNEHDCLYCCLCFKTLTIDELHIRDDGFPEDVCIPCAEEEAREMKRRGK